MRLQKLFMKCGRFLRLPFNPAGANKRVRTGICLQIQFEKNVHNTVSNSHFLSCFFSAFIGFCALRKISQICFLNSLMCCNSNQQQKRTETARDRLCVILQTVANYPLRFHFIFPWFSLQSNLFLRSVRFFFYFCRFDFEVCRMPTFVVFE